MFVRALKWTEDEEHAMGYRENAECVFGVYWVEDHENSGECRLYLNRHLRDYCLGSFNSLDEAKTAAQEHFKAVILSEFEAVEEPNAWNSVAEYILQDDLHNRLTPRVVDVAYTAFMKAKENNDENGGPTDWFTDTKPIVDDMISSIKRDLDREKKVQTL